MSVFLNVISQVFEKPFEYKLNFSYFRLSNSNPDYYRSSYFPAMLNNYFILLRIFEPSFSLDFTVRSLPSINSASKPFGIELLSYPNSLNRVYVTKYRADNSSASLCSQIRD